MKTDPNNPFRDKLPPAFGEENRHDRIARRIVEPRDVYDEHARGLDGDAIDALLKTRMTEGIHLGHVRGYNEAARNFPEIHDQGYDFGCAEGERQLAGKEEEIYQRARGALARLAPVAELLLELKVKTPARQTRRHSKLQEAMDQLHATRTEILG